MVTALLPTAVLAHEGGWDEALLVAVPMVVVGWLLWLAKRRVDRAAARPSAPDATTERGDGPSVTG